MSEKKHTRGTEPNSIPTSEETEMQDQRMQDLHAQLMREKDEPSEGFSPIPIFLLFVFSALCFWGGVYIVENSGGFRWDAYTPDFDPDADAPAPAIIPLAVRGERIYRSQCQACHQADGQGIAGVYPPLVGTDWVTGHPEVLARVLINGLSGPIEVRGNTYNGNMPAFGPNGLNLRTSDLAAVASYIRQEWGNSAPEIPESLMQSYMATYAGRGTQWRADELLEGLSEAPQLEEAEAPAEEEAEAEETAEVPAEEAEA